MIFTIKVGLVPSLERSLHSQIQEAIVRALLEAYTANNLPFIGTRLILQQEIAFEHGEIWMDAEKCFAKMHKDNNLKYGVRVEMN
jgi:hypothetical protein